MQQLELLLQQAHERHKQSSSSGNSINISIENTVRVWGSYLGEVIRRKWGGVWMLSGKDVYLEISGKRFSPIQQVYERITLGQQYDIEVYIANNTSGNFSDTNMVVPHITQESKQLPVESSQPIQRSLQRENLSSKKTNINVRTIVVGLLA